MWNETELLVGDTELESFIGYEMEDETRPEFDVIGPTDDRFPIPARRQRPSTLLFPMNTICFLERDTGSGFQFGGTGTLIAPQVVLTAKHVLMNFNNIRPRRPRRCAVERGMTNFHLRMRVTPGADLSQTRPALAAPVGQHIAPGTSLRADPNLDYGIIILPRPVPRINNFMRLQARGRQNTATLLTLAGYPCDKPRGTMWGHSGRIPLVDVTPTHLHYTLDTCPGHSGSPIWLLGNNNIRLLLGVHTNGVVNSRRCPNDPVTHRCRPTGAPPPTVPGKNCGVRITPHVINTIVGWCRAAGVRGPVVDRAGMPR